jgi:NADH-quinone oxidoreductase subunit G
MPTIYIDNKPYQVKEGLNLLHACLSLGFDIPYFCWHPAMHSVGACRMCAVKQFKDEKDTRGRIIMSCMTPAAEGMRISIDDADAVKFRRCNTEWLMLSHPHDCPVCDEGGECHLQDMTLMTGHVYRRQRFEKRTYRNQDLGPFVAHEMNRCIACYRCVRFYCDYAGGRDLAVMGWHDGVYFGRHRDGTLESPFSGNLVEICPTGVFTDKTFARHYTRKWDLQTAPSVCVHCSLGCNTIPGERYGTLRRIRNRFNYDVNGYFLCDRGRYGYEFVNSDKRVRQPMLGRQPIAGKAVLDGIAPFLRDREKVIGIGSPRASLESNFALRSLVGADRFYSGVSDSQSELLDCVLNILRQGPARSASLQDARTSDAVLVLGEDVSSTAPMVGLAVRQTTLIKPMAVAEELDIEPWHDTAVREVIQGQTGPVFIATPGQTQIDDIATAVYRSAPGDIARLGFAVAHEIDPAAPPVPDLPQQVALLARNIATALKDSKRPLVVSGTSCNDRHILHAAANVADALHAIGLPARICFGLPACNSLGVSLLGGRCISRALDAVRNGEVETVIVVENDLYRSFGARIAEQILCSPRNIVVLDSLENRTTARASMLLPAATFAESDGTLVSTEGRAQRHFRVFAAPEPVQASWQWLRDMMNATEHEQAQRWQCFDDIGRELAAEFPIFGPLSGVALSRDFKVAGAKIPRQPHRYSGRTAMHADISVSEPAPPADDDSPLAFSMEGYEGQPPAALLSNLWAPGWNSVQSVDKFQTEVGGPLRGGDQGKRLIEPHAQAAPPYFGDIPAGFEPPGGQLLVVPAYHVFGSEELSVLSPGVAERSPRPYIALAPDDARQLNLQEGDILDVLTYRLPVVLSQPLAKGLAAVPCGLPDMSWSGVPFLLDISSAAGAGT